MRYFGDSYDIVKQSILRWLLPLGAWEVHPMFTEPVTPEETSAFEAFLAAKVISTEVLTPATDRASYLSCSSASTNLFLDPDTGVRIKISVQRRAHEYLFADELVQLAKGRPHALTIVFDQSVARGSERAQLQAKLSYLGEKQVYGFAYLSHACFLIMSGDRTVATEARRLLIAESRLPDQRFLPVSPLLPIHSLARANQV